MRPSRRRAPERAHPAARHSCAPITPSSSRSETRLAHRPPAPVRTPPCTPPARRGTAQRYGVTPAPRTGVERDQQHAEHPCAPRLRLPVQMEGLAGARAGSWAACGRRGGAARTAVGGRRGSRRATAARCLRTPACRRRPRSYGHRRRGHAAEASFRSPNATGPYVHRRPRSSRPTAARPRGPP